MSRTARLAAIAVAAALAAEPAVAQEPGAPAVDAGFELRTNYPNPFNPDTTIPFFLGEELFADGGPIVVTMRVFDPLAMLIAHPVALDHPDGRVSVRSLEYSSPGQHEAFWNGTDASGAPVAAGVYFVELTVNDQRVVRRMYRSIEAISGGAR